MLDVVGVGVLCLSAAGEPASLVSDLQRSAHRRRYQARRAADRERLAVLFDHTHDRSVTGELAGDADRQGSSVLEATVGTRRLGRAGRVDVNVDDNAVHIG
jgi:hypothetical protein